jgi:diguanylate cyclase (GGDEF)-like protein
VRRRWLSTLHVRLIMLVLFALVPVLGLLLMSNLQDRRRVTAELEVNAQRLTRLVAGSHDRLLDGARQLLASLAQVPQLRGGSRESCDGMLAEVLRQYPRYANIGVVAANGQLLCSAAPVAGASNLKERAFFRGATAKRDFAVGDHEIGPITGTAVLNFGYPALDGEGRILAVLFASLEFGWLSEFATDAELPERATLIIFDRAGMVLARHPDPRRWVGRLLPDAPIVQTILNRGEGLTETTALDGVSRVYAFTSLTGPQKDSLYVVTGLSKRAALAEADRLLVRNVVVLALVAMLTLGAAWFYGDRFLLRPLTQLVNATERLSAGDLGARLEVRGSGEIEAVASAFNAMANRFALMVETEQQAKEALAKRVNDLVAERTREVALLQEMGELLEACFTVEEAHTVVGQQMSRIFPDHGGAVCLINGARNIVEAVTTWGTFGVGDRGAFLPDDCWALRRGRVHVVEDVTIGLLCKHLTSVLPSAYLCIPLVAHGEALGVLHVNSAERSPGHPAHLSQDKQRFAGAVAEEIALTLANLKMRETLRSQSIRDHLTGLFNRRYMEETLELELRRAQRTQRPIALMILDVDHFKRFNDRFGHEAGDALLAEMGRVLRTHLRGGDIPCRLGGEEFLVIMPDTLLVHARKRSEQVCAIIRDLKLTHRGTFMGAVTISIGIAVFPEHGTTAEALIRNADRALYRAKHEGRDRVQTADAAVDG